MYVRHSDYTHVILETKKRRYPRVHVGLPVRLHLDGDPEPLTIELVDVSLEGALFRTDDVQPQLGQRVGFGFVLPDYSICAARGKVVRIRGDHFALELEDRNPEFESFLLDISGPYICAA